MAAIHSSAGHIRKKQYQPSIASYFSRDGHSHTSPQPLSHPPTFPLSPPLPLETQASLLSVGMRVRKSVPEGYKTHKTLLTQQIPFASTAPAPLSTPSQSRHNMGATRELTPFCGLHKTGGWATQEIPFSSAPAVMISENDEDGSPGLTLSQNTIASSQNSSVGGWTGQVVESRKRGYEEDIEDELDAFFDVEVFETPAIRTDRPMARIKGTAGKPARVSQIRVFGVDDFEDAEFLVPMDGMEVDAT